MQRYWITIVTVIDVETGEIMTKHEYKKRRNLTIINKEKKYVTDNRGNKHKVIEWHVERTKQLALFD